jgi:hypothetical protein
VLKIGDMCGTETNTLGVGEAIGVLHVLLRREVEKRIHGFLEDREIERG